METKKNYVMVFKKKKNELFSYQGKKEGKDQELIQPSTTPDPGY